MVKVPIDEQDSGSSNDNFQSTSKQRENNHPVLPLS